MKFNLAVIGYLPEGKAVRGQIDKLTGDIERTMFPGESPRINAIISPEYTGDGWSSYLAGKGYAVSGCALKADRSRLGGCDRSVLIDASDRSVIGESVCSRADMILMVWNEDIREMDGAVWEIMQRAQHAKTPCVWVSSGPSSAGKVCWASGSSFEPYRPELLDGLYKSFSARRLEPSPPEKKPRFLLSAGIRLRNNYLNRHNAGSVEVTAKNDVLLRDDYIESEPAAEEMRRALLERFRAFDRSAIQNSAMFQSVMYWRGILPFITTVFLAVALYAGPILRFLPIKIFSETHVLDIIMGIGFLVYAALNLYVYRLSKNPFVTDWRRQFLDSRYVAEMLRVLIHFTPYGISMDLRKLSGGDESICATVRDIIDENEKSSIELDKGRVRGILDHAVELLKDQISYHEFSAERYRSIVRALRKWYSVIFKIGFALVLLRTMMQFALVLDGTLYDIPFSDNVISTANTCASVIAMLIPAWAAYFLSKLTHCSYEYNYENHCNMAKNLRAELERLEYSKNFDSSVLLETLGFTAERLSEALLVDDTYPWRGKIQGSKVTTM